MARPDVTMTDAAAEPVNITMVTYNRLEFTRRSIASIAESAGYPYALTVVDNASIDGTPAVLRDLQAQGTVHNLIINDENMGVAFAANQGWAAGAKAHYLKLDNDIVFTRQGWLARLVEICDGLGKLGAVAYNFETTSYATRVVDGHTVRLKEGNVGGACVMIPERAHRLVGYWCEDYWPYGEEDLDMYVRLRAVGLESYYMEDEDIGLHLPEGKAGPLEGAEGRSVFDEGDPQYRLEKDRWRADYAGERGLRRINENLYRKGLRSIYVPHAIPYRPSILARLYALAKFRRLRPWPGRHVLKTRQ